MDEITKRLIDRIQLGIPVEERPFAVIGSDLGLSEEQVLEALRNLHSSGLLSFLGPIYATRATGHRTTLMAMEAPNIEEAASVVGSYPGVSHCYERGHQFNLWSTLAVPPGVTLASVAREMARRGGCKRVILLPERRRYKLRVHFRMTDQKAPVDEGKPARPRRGKMSDSEIDVLRLLQGGFPLVARPFNDLAGSGEKELIASLRNHLARKLVRRVAGLVRHHKVGYRANGMAVWQVPEDRADEVGLLLARCESVSHCYLRRRAKDWPYSHYAMLHGKKREEVSEKAHQLAKEAGLTEPFVLFSLREFKKERLRLYTPEYKTWFMKGANHGRE